MGIRGAVDQLDFPVPGELGTQDVDGALHHAGIAFDDEIQFQPGCIRGRGKSRRWRDGIGRNRRIFGQLAQPLADRRGGSRIGLPFALMGGEQILEHVAGIEEGIDHVIAQAEFALAHAVEQVFQDMRDILQVGEAECAARSLDRMRRPEDRVQLLGIGSVHVQPQQQVLHVGQMLAGLLEKDLVELAHVDGHVASLQISGAAPFSR